jgi:hypothetical protein
VSFFEYLTWLNIDLLPSKDAHAKLDDFVTKLVGALDHGRCM